MITMKTVFSNKINYNLSHILVLPLAGFVRCRSLVSALHLNNFHELENYST
jgi:hypothetical protein